MRMLLRAQMDTSVANKAIKDGTLPKLLQSTMEYLKPEAAFFTTTDGTRTAFIVFDLQEPAQMPAVAEPFFMELNAKVDFVPAMTAEDVQTGLQHLGH
jgi:hypothetical protein